jgi:putative aldouronate transport system permease protein
MKKPAGVRRSPASCFGGGAMRLRSGFVRNVVKFRVLYLMILLPMAVLIFNNYIPMFGVIVAFKNYNFIDGIWHSPWEGMDNFKYLYQTEDAWVATRNTVLYNALFIVLNTVGAIFMSIGLNEIRSRKLTRFFQSSLLFPYFLSFVVVSYLAYAFLGGYGFINSSILRPLGLHEISWYTDPKYWTVILPVVQIWKNVGYFGVIYLAAIVGIDQEYYEAAVIDGASKWQQIRRITIPLMAPVIIVMVILQIGKIFNADFGLFYQVPRNTGALFPTTNVIDTFVYRALLFSGDVGMSAAANLYQAVVGFVLVLATNFVVRRFSKENALF